MQRTAVIFGLALSTLVGSFVLVPRTLTGAPAPDVLPAARPPDTTPVTELVFADETLEVTARLDRAHVLASAFGSALGHADGSASAPGAESLWLDVGVKATGAAVRAPLTTVLVIDRSGSMAGDKIDAARLAAEAFIRDLRDGDALGIVSFATDVSMDLPLTSIDAASRARARAVVRHLDEGGGTNIDGAFTEARKVLAGAALHGRVARVILVSDGRPTEGDRRDAALAAHVTKLRQQGIGTSTLGLGLDYNENLMELLAVEGGGRYHHLREADALAKILDDELQQAAAVVASRVKVLLPELPGLTVVDTPGNRLVPGARAAIDLGDLSAGEERHVLLRLAPAPASQWIVPAPEVTYRAATTGADALVSHRSVQLRALSTSDAALVERGRRDDVRVRVLQLEASLALTASMQAWATGDAVRARAALEQTKAELDQTARATGSASMAAEAANLGAVLDAVQAGPASASAAGQELVKAQRARAFQLRR